jgi:hypothetical protein
MPHRKTLLISAGIALVLLLLAAVAFIALLSQPVSKPPVTITLLRCQRTQFGYFLANVAITNISSDTIQYYEMRRKARVRIETITGWITNAIQLEAILRNPTILAPGSIDVERIHLPHNAIQFQLCYTIPTLSPRDSLRSRPPPKSYPRLNSLLKPLLTDKRGPDFEFSTPFFQVADKPVPAP